VREGFDEHHRQRNFRVVARLKRVAEKFELPSERCQLGAEAADMATATRLMRLPSECRDAMGRGEVQGRSADYGETQHPFQRKPGAGRLDIRETCESHVNLPFIVRSRSERATTIFPDGIRVDVPAVAAHSAFIGGAFSFSMSVDVFFKRSGSFCRCTN
jgi:hypothetical protein